MSESLFDPGPPARPSPDSSSLDFDTWAASAILYRLRSGRTWTVRELDDITGPARLRRVLDGLERNGLIRRRVAVGTDGFEITRAGKLAG